MDGERTEVIILLSLVALLLAACEGERAEGIPAECEVENPRGPVMENDVPTERGVLELREAWRAGGLDGNEHLEMPVHAAVAPGGRVVVPDWGLSEVKTIGPDGIWEGSAFRTGGGPGEVTTPSAAAWGGDDRLAVLDWQNVRVELKDLESDTTRSLALDPHLAGKVMDGGAVAWNAVQPDGSIFVQFPVARGDEPGERVKTFARAHPQREGADSVFTTAEWRVPSPPGWGEDVSVPGMPTGHMAAGVDRWAVVPRSDRYEVEVWASDARRETDEALAHFCQPVSSARGEAAGESVPFPDPDTFEVAGWDQVMEALREGPAPDDPVVVQGLTVDRDGRVWVLRDPPVPGSAPDRLWGPAGATYDVFDQEGIFLATATMPAGFRLQDATGDRLIGFELGEYQEVYVVALDAYW